MSWANKRLLPRKLEFDSGQGVVGAQIRAKGEDRELWQHHLGLVREEPETGSLQRGKDEADAQRMPKRFRMASWGWLSWGEPHHRKQKVNAGETSEIEQK